jgi:signal transduction histidine kinase
MEATPADGAIEIRTSYRARHGHDPASIVLEVADTGIGIVDADLRRVFRPLFSTKPRGTGLGLSFCRQTVEEHGGEIRLTSRGKDQGANAIITLPVRQS